MKKVFSVLVLFLFFSSCNRPKDKEHIQNFIFAGYRGFLMVDSANWKYDSTQFDIREYLEYESDSSVKIAKRYYNSKTKFFKIIPYDSLKLAATLEKLINLKLTDTDFYPAGLSMYDGLYYSLDFSTNKNRHIKIDYNPYELPKELRDIHDTIEKIISRAKDSYAGNFSYNNQLRQKALELYRKSPPPPAPEPLEQKVNWKKGVR